MQRNLKLTHAPKLHLFQTHNGALPDPETVPCALFGVKKKKKIHTGIAFTEHDRAWLIWPHLCVCFQPKGEVSQDMRYPICPIRHLFLNRPHLHSLPRSIHKKIPIGSDELPWKKKQKHTGLSLRLEPSSL